MRCAREPVHNEEERKESAKRERQAASQYDDGGRSHAGDNAMRTAPARSGQDRKSHTLLAVPSLNILFIKLLLFFSSDGNAKTNGSGVTNTVNFFIPARKYFIVSLYKLNHHFREKAH